MQLQSCPDRRCEGMRLAAASQSAMLEVSTRCLMVSSCAGYREIAQPEAEQQTARTQFTSHFTAHRNRRIRLVGGANRLRDQLQHGRMQRGRTYATASSVRSMASVYWIRSLVPIEKSRDAR